MSEEQTYKITKMTALHGISAQGDVLLVGAQVDDHATGWGECSGLFNDASLAYHFGAAASTIHKVVTPVLQERPFTHLRDLFQRLETLVEPVTFLDPPAPPPPQTGMSRRSIMTGTFQESAAPDPKMEKRMGERPLPPNLQFGICQALLNAFAHARKQTPAKLLTKEYELKSAKKKFGLHVEVTDENMTAVSSILKLHVKSLGYNIQTRKPAKALGEKGENLTTLVQQLTAWLATKSVDPQLAIHLNLHGALAELFGTNTGQMLHLLHALQDGAAPYRMRVENLGKAWGGEKPTRIYWQLQSFLEHQTTPAELWVGCPYYAPAAMEQLIASGKIDGVHLDVTQMGNVERVMTTIAQCQEQNIPVMVSGGTKAGGVETAVAIATATGADLITGPPDLVYNTLQQSRFG